MGGTLRPIPANRRFRRHPPPAVIIKGEKTV